MSLEDRTRAAAARVSSLLEGAGPAAHTRMPNSEWSPADAVAHVISGLAPYVGFLQGVPSPVADVSETPRYNAEYLAAYPERDPAVLGRELREGIDGLIAAYAEGDPERMITWHAGQPLSARHTLGLALGELVVHGWDIAQALGRPWPIDPADAAEILTAGLHVAPVMVDPAAAKGLTGVVEVRLRGQTTRSLTWTDGRLSVGVPEAGGGRKPDCIVSADPVAMLVQSYGRGSKWKPILTGKVVAYGRKPLLALRMQNALRNP